MGQQPTVKDVARSAGVSRRTVSDVVNSPSIAEAATRARREAASTGSWRRPNPTGSSPTLIIRRPGTVPIYGASTQTSDRL